MAGTTANATAITTSHVSSETGPMPRISCISGTCIAAKCSRNAPTAPASSSGLRNGDSTNALLVSERQFPMWKFSKTTINSNRTFRASCVSQPRFIIQANAPKPRVPIVRTEATIRSTMSRLKTGSPGGRGARRRTSPSLGSNASATP
jgi:hypothetical protein